MCLQNEYLSLVEQCMDFACEMMDLCRGTQEVEAVLSEGGEENGHTSRDPLARLKMAIEYEEKKVGHVLYSPSFSRALPTQPATLSPTFVPHAGLDEAF